MAIDQLQRSRFELKYVLKEEVALQVRDFVSSYLDLDENGVGKPNYSYPVHSLYLDSDGLRLYWETINGNKNRFKLRIRFYNSNPEAPVFLEIKRRMNNCIMKQRAGVRREAVETVLAGQVPDPDCLVSKDPKHEHALLRFCELLVEVQAKPKAHIAYLREAYVSHDNNSARVTLDRQVLVAPQLVARLTTRMDRPVMIWGRDVVLELKFTDRFPGWFGDLVERFGLTQRSAAKYVDGVAELGESRFSPGRAGQPETAWTEDEIFLPNPGDPVLIDADTR